MYDIKIYPNTLAPWFSQIFAGLFDLQRSGKVRLSISTDFVHSELFDSTSLALEVKESSTGKKCSILVDMNDNRNLRLPQAIEWFDVLVKRSFFKPELKRLQNTSYKKVLPYGINFNCGSPNVPIRKLFVAHQLMRFRLIGKKKSEKIRFAGSIR